MTQLLRIVRDVAAAVRIADIVDIIVVAVFTYAAISWVQRARSRFVMLGFATLVGVYFVARLLDMYLTLFLFQAGITVALLALVVIFQEELRRTFERIATSGILRPERVAASAVNELIAPLVAVASELARSRTGALIVLRGKEPLERHTTGGIVLDGRLSQPLLCSIFDPSSPGHDGAVIVESGRISRFGVHLPLSTRFKDGSPLGTRHSAALGLSERSDALIVVVSEERGTMSLAQGGQLDEMRTGAALERRLAEFCSEVAPARRSTPWQRLVARNFGRKVLSLGLAVFAWLLVFAQQTQTVARTFEVPIIYRNVPDGWLLDDPEPLIARVTIAAKSRSFEGLNPETLRLSVDGAILKPGKQTFDLAPSQLGLPTGFTVHQIDPDVVTFTASPTVALELPVRSDLVGRLPRGLLLANTEVTPARVRAMVARSERGRLTALRTEPLDLSGVTETSTVMRGVVIPKGCRLARGEPTEVQVRLTIEAQSKDD